MGDNYLLVLVRKAFSDFERRVGRRVEPTCLGTRAAVGGSPTGSSGSEVSFTATDIARKADDGP